MVRTFQILSDNNLTFNYIRLNQGVSDDTGVLADTLYDKYFSYAVEAGQEGNFSFLTPGMVDVSQT